MAVPESTAPASSLFQEPYFAALKDAIVRVGDGRGFFVEHPRGRRIITAAHCLPYLPPAHRLMSHERTYAKLVGPRDVEPTVWAECLFVDPVADVAVLASPDSHAFPEEAEAYENFTEGRPTFLVGGFSDTCTAWVLSRSGEWVYCLIEPGGRGQSVTLVNAREGGGPGTSGSPILTSHGYAVSVVTHGSESVDKDGVRKSHIKVHNQPMLVNDLPAGLLSEMLNPQLAMSVLAAALREGLPRLVAYTNGGA